MQFGEFELLSVSGGRFRLDGGAMFGVVPKPLWERKSPSDSHNRIQLDTNCLVIRSGEHSAICDTGYGSKLSSKELGHIDAPAGETLSENLESSGVSAERMTHVLFSHLHFDHAGGATRFQDESGALGLTFPNAIHVVQKQEFEDATSGRLDLEGSYYPEIAFLFENAGKLLLDGDREIFPGVKLLPTGGHTAGHQIIQIQSEDSIGYYLGDICPTSAHLNVFWSMAYDAFQLDVRRQKFKWLNEIADTQSILFFDHDPEIRAARIKRKGRRSFEVSEVIEL